MSIENKDELNEKLDIMTEDVIAEDVVTEDVEIKKMFEEEFDMADLTVSEDLIARTMTAIRGLSGDGAETESASVDAEPESKITNIAGISRANKKTETTKTTEISTVRKSSVIKWISGIAAALFIGIVGFTFIKLGLNGSVKEDSATSTNMSANSENYSSVKSDGYETRRESEKNSFSDRPMTEASASIPMTDDVYEYDGEDYGLPSISANGNAYKFSPDETKNDAYLGDIINHEKQVLTTPTDSIPDELTPGATENAGGSSGVDNSDNKETEAEELKEFVVIEADILLQNIANYRNNPKADKDAMIRKTREYKNIVNLDVNAEDTLYKLLAESEGDAELEYIYAVLLEDVSGKTFTDDNASDIWSTGKEYLKLYEASIENAD